MEHLRCVVERITYQNADNGYTVLKCAVKNYSDLVTVVGTMPDTHVGSVLSLEGMWKMDARYGRQFSVEKFEETLPATVYGIEKYLGSGLVKGVGPKFAKRIVEKFGKDTLNIIEDTPDKLLTVQGIGKVRVDRIKTSWQEQKEIKNIMLFLQSHEVSTSHATKIFKTYGSESIAIVKENPYRLADDIWGIGFKTADSIAQKMGIDKGKFVRLRSGTFYTLNKLAEAGHCYATREQLIGKARELLEVEDAELEITLDEMIRTNDVIREVAGEQEAVYLPPYYFSESGCAKRLIRLMSCGKKKSEDAEEILKKVAASSEITYDEIQWQAVKTAISSKVMVLTGGPGTGKTTTTLGIISAYKQAGCQIILAAPTGRAAKRMSEATGMEAKTIHRLLEYKPPEGYQKNEEHPLEGDVLILDECSMIDIMLMYNLLKALPEQMSLILVGDIDQLPSVGAGNVLRDIIDSGCVPVVRLTRIFRQAQGSRIIMNAHRINKGESIDMRGGKDSDFFFATKQSNQEVVDTIVQYCRMNLPRYYHVNPLQDIQVLTPMQRGECGAVNLNQVLQEAMNPSKIFLRRGGTQYRLKDKVMQIRNDYDKEVFNGDIGTITKVDMEERELILLLKQGSKDAFTALYKQYWKQVYNFSRLYLTSADAAEEVVQEVFIKIWETREFLREDDHFKGLLFIITRNLIFNRHRKNMNEDFYKVTVLAALEEPYDVEEEIDAHNLQEYIDRLIDELPPRRREIFNLSRKEQKSYKEIAILLNISEKTVENQISETLKYLKKNITLLLLFI